MSKSIATSVLLSGLLAVVPPSPAQEHSVNPGINAHYQRPDYSGWVNVFEREGREVFDHREEIVAALGLRTGMTVADIGAGTGLFTRLMAPEVAPGGRVIAVDISEVFVENTLRRARAEGLANIEGVVNTPVDVTLPEGSIDLAFVCDTYHHFEYPQRMLHSIHRALQSGGELVVIDYERLPGTSSPWLMGHMRASKDVVIREIEQQGFRLLEQWKFHPQKYFLRFARTGDVH